MGTRGVVAIKQGNSWRGVYNHFDSYPEGLGADLFEHLQSKDLHQFAKDLMQFDDWRDYLNGGVCPYCGGVGLGQPHTISMAISEAAPPGSTKFPDPERKYHMHSYDNKKRSEVRANCTPDNEKKDALWWEWVYIVDSETRTIKILTNCMASKSKVDGPADFQWVEVCVISIDQKDIDWGKIGELGSEISDQYYEKYGMKGK